MALALNLKNLHYFDGMQFSRGSMPRTPCLAPQSGIVGPTIPTHLRPGPDQFSFFEFLSSSCCVPLVITCCNQTCNIKNSFSEIMKGPVLAGLGGKWLIVTLPIYLDAQVHVGSTSFHSNISYNAFLQTDLFQFQRTRRRNSSLVWRCWCKIRRLQTEW